MLVFARDKEAKTKILRGLDPIWVFQLSMMMMVMIMLGKLYADKLLFYLEN